MTSPKEHAGCGTANSSFKLRHFNESCAFVVKTSVTARSSTKGHQYPRVVGVITSRAEFDFAIRMNEPPDLFELRLDRLVRVIDRIENKISRLRAPLVITARHPMEGGADRLSPLQRHNLLA